MKEREKIQRNHEKAVIAQYLEWLNSTQPMPFQIIGSPEPPDAIISNGSLTTWVEHADVYRSSEEAKEERTGVLTSEPNYVRPDPIICEPDRGFAIAFAKTVQKKLSKDSYKDTYDQYGQGALILTERDPLFTQSTLDETYNILGIWDMDYDKGYFSHVYLAPRGENGKLIFIDVSDYIQSG